MNNVISAIYTLTHKQIQSGPGCNFNGFISQISVQATDCSILAITIVTVLTITNKTSGLIDHHSSVKNFLIAGACWILPLITASIGLATHNYSPATGGWCWLKPQPVYLRYVLTHAWRITFIIVEIVLFTHLYLYLRSHFKALDDASHGNSGSGSALLGNRQDQSTKFSTVSTDSTDEDEPSTALNNSGIQKGVDIQTGIMNAGSEGSNSSVTSTITSPSRKTMTMSFFKNPIAFFQKSHMPIPPSPAGRGGVGLNASNRPKKIQRVLLLSVYPIAYIILWIPGIANRLSEAAGHPSPALQVLQSTTTYIGFANAITYGWNEKIASHFKKRFNEIKQNRRSWRSKSANSG